MATGRAGQEVFMKTDVVRGMAKDFKSIGQFLQGVAKTLEALSTTLKVTAFIGLVGGYALANVIDKIKPQIEQMADKCENMGKELESSVNAYENGDALGATRFY